MVLTLKKLDKKELLRIFINSIKRSGWEPLVLDYKHPFKIRINKDKKYINLKVIINNISHGGKTRSKNEFRIQIKEKKPLEEENFKTIILGYWLLNDVFVAYDVKKHKGVPGWSSSMQINKRSLEFDPNNKFSIHINSKKERIICFKSKDIIDYILNIDNLHKYSPDELFFSL